MNKKTMEIIGFLLAIIGAIALIPSTRESILSWIEEKKPLIVEVERNYEGDGLPILSKKNVENKLIYGWEDTSKFLSGTMGSLDLYVKNQNTKSELALSLNIPIKLIDYQKPIENYYVDALFLSVGGKGGGVVKTQHFYSSVNPNIDDDYYAYYIDDINAFFESPLAPVEQLSVFGSSEYYYLEPGDVEIFTITISFPEPGDYRFQVGIDMFTDKGEKETIWVDKVFEVSIASGLNLWKDSHEQGQFEFPYDLEKIASCTFQPEKGNKSFLSNYNCGAPILDDEELSLSSVWPTQECSDIDSRLEVGKKAQICPQIGFDLDLYESPSYESKMGISFSGSQVFSIIYGPVCNQDVPWWRVMEDGGDFAQVGWFYEVGFMNSEYVLCPVD